MDIAKFCTAFETVFPRKTREQPTRIYSLRLKCKMKLLYVNYYVFDPIRDVEGMISVKKQRLLNLAYAHLPPEEAYLEIGTWHGKSLIAAMRNNPPRPPFACDNFSEWEASKGSGHNPRSAFLANLQRYGLAPSVTFYDEPFQQIFTKEKLPFPVGLCFDDAAPDEQSQYLGIKLVEPFLAEEALVLVDDWRFAPDSQSYAKAGTQRAITESEHGWTLLYELPARYNGDRALWWNGVAIFRFQKRPNPVMHHFEQASIQPGV